MSRTITWDGLHNARDLGGLPTSTGTTAYGRFFRAPRLEVLTQRGWGELAAAGVRTIIDLRNPAEVGQSVRPFSVGTTYLPIEDPADPDFMARWGRHLNSPVYYPENLRRWPAQVASVFAAMADAPPGGILFHCAAGRDRTGLIASMLLQLGGVPVPAILADYELAVRAMNEHFKVAPHGREVGLDAAELDAWVRRTRDHLATFLAATDVRSFLVAQGLSEAQVGAIGDRLTEPD